MARGGTIGRAERPAPYRGRRGGRGGGPRWWVDAAGVAVLAALVAAAAVAYVGREQTVYFWDWANYHEATLREADRLRGMPWGSAFARSVYDVLRELRWSTGADYPDLHTVPMVPVVLAFGRSRAAYVAGLAVVYMLPFALAVGALATELVAERRRWAFWAGAVVTLLLPATWLPTLNGYPDAAAAALVAVGAYLLLRDQRLPRWWQLVLAGLAFAVAALVRRHFLYDAIAVFGAALVAALAAGAPADGRGGSLGGSWGAGRARRGRGAPALRSLGTAALRLGAAGAVMLLALYEIGRPFADVLLRTNFTALYASYQLTAAENLAYFREFYGWAALVLAALGVAVALRMDALSRRAALFVAVAGVWSVAQWAWAVGQLSIQYTLHFTPWVALGLVALAAAVRAAVGGGVVAFGAGLAGAAYLAVGMVGSLTTALGAGDARGGPVDPRPAPPAGGLLPLRMPPARRGDLPELDRLVRYLRAEAGPGVPVLVAGSSFRFNDEVLVDADRRVPGERLSFPRPAHVDSRDTYPLRELLAARYVVVALPFQHHLRPEAQGVVLGVVEALTQGWEIGQDFTLLPQEFTLDGGVRIRVYRRTRPTDLPTAVRTLEQLRRVVGAEWPGQQRAWTELATPPGTSVQVGADSAAELRARVDSAGGAMTVLTVPRADSLPARVRVEGELAPGGDCTAAAVEAAAVSAGGQITADTTTTVFASGAPSFALPLAGAGARYVALTVRPVAACTVAVRGVRVR